MPPSLRTLATLMSGVLTGMQMIALHPCVHVHHTALLSNPALAKVALQLSRHSPCIISSSLQLYFLASAATPKSLARSHWLRSTVYAATRFCTREIAL